VNAPQLILITLAFVAANLPFANERVGLFGPARPAGKNFAWRLLEWFALYFIVGGIARLLEGRLGAPQHQNWEFYAITLCLFMVFAYPGFVYRYLWRKR
jgi:Na+-driven multidrug efflux pump